MNAIELAKDLETNGIGMITRKLIIAELRRLAEIERKYNEIMAQEPVAWVTMQLPDPQKGVITDAKFARYYNQSHMKLTTLYELKKD
jgi:hypothetical protein